MSSDACRDEARGMETTPVPRHQRRPPGGEIPPAAKREDTTLNRLSFYKSIYEAIRATLVAETMCRPGRALDEWILAERGCVMREVNRQRKLLAYKPISLAAVERAESTACGHSGYVSKYAHAAADLVFRKEVM